MKEKLTDEEVYHVAHLARIEIDDDELENYKIKLKQILHEIEKMNELEVDNEDILIAQINKEVTLRDDVKGEMLDPKEALKNTPNKSGDFIKVPVMIHD